MRILVTGAAGFIGFHLSKRLLERGDEVIGIDNLNDYYDVNLKLARLRQLEGRPGFRFLKLDIADRAAVPALFRDTRPQRVVNLAAQAGVRYSLTNPHAYVDSNLVGFVNILEGCRHHAVEHLVYASSSSVYGGNTQMPFSVHQNVDHPLSLYAATKKANELMAHTYSHLYRLPTTGLRFFTVYGPWGRPDMALFLFTKAILEDRPIDLYNEGRMQRDFTYIDDIIEGVTRVLDRIPTPLSAPSSVSSPSSVVSSPHSEVRGPVVSGPEVSGPQSEVSGPVVSWSRGPMVSSPVVSDPAVSGPHSEVSGLVVCGPVVPPSAPYRLYNIGNNNPVELLHFVEVIEQCLGKKAKKRMLPMQPGDIPAAWADVDDLMRDVGFKPATPIEERCTEVLGLVSELLSAKCRVVCPGTGVNSGKYFQTSAP